MSDASPVNTWEETADEYGRLEGCFVDHQTVPFTLQHILPQVRHSANSAESSLISGQELRAARVPQPAIQPDDFNYADASLNSLLRASEGSDLLPLLWYPLSICQALKLPCDEIDLGSDPVDDLVTYEKDLSVWSQVNLSKTWLPLSRTEAEFGGGLHFPSSSERTRLLLYREIERETIVSADDYLKVLGELQLQNYGAYPRYTRSEPQCFRSQRITPPLSPIAECADPFVPGREVCVIDLTSEPESLPDVLESRVALEAHDDVQGLERVEELTLASTTHESPPSTTPRALPEAIDNHNKLEMPLLPDSSGEQFVVEIPTECGGMAGVDGLSLDMADAPSIFGQGLAEVLERSKIASRSSVKFESLDTLGCLLRLHVGTMDFDIPAAEWNVHISDPERHYAFLRDSLPRAFRFAFDQSHVFAETMLKWNPIPRTSIDLIERETLLPIDDSVESFLLIMPPSMPSGQEQLVRLSSMICFQVSYADEQDLLIEDLSEKAMTTVEHYAKSRFFAAPGRYSDTQNQKDDSNACILHIPESNIPSPECYAGVGDTPVETCSPLPQAIKRKSRRCHAQAVVQRVKTGGTTGNLLDAFMQLRAQKRPRLDNERNKGAGKPREIPASTKIPCVEEEQATAPALPATSPTLQLPTNKACYITSLKLGRVMLKLLDTYWPRHLLFDRDYDRHRTTMWSPVSAQTYDVVPLLCHDADVALTPHVGVVVTTILKAAQKPLPGSKEPTPLRRQIETVCGKYDTVLVLVSENHEAGGTPSSLNPSIAAAYADLVHFTTTLPNDCVCYFVPGDSETLAKWITSLMCTYSPQALMHKDLMNPVEMSWEVFLRRAGMNVMAAQVLAGRLSQQGNDGLSRFLAMSTQEKINGFGDLVGKSALVKVSQALDRRWC